LNLFQDILVSAESLWRDLPFFNCHLKDSYFTFLAEAKSGYHEFVLELAVPNLANDLWE
jgi:hypothetical protein